MQSMKPNVGIISRTALNAAGTAMVVIGTSGCVEIWDIVHQIARQRFNHPHTNYIYACVLSDNYVFTACKTGQLYRTDLSTLEKRVLGETPQAIYSLAVSRGLCVYLTQTTVTVIDKHTNETVYELSDDKTNFIHCAFTPNEQYLVIVPMAGPILVWSVAGRLLHM
jgi:WD40 repeat protein